MARVVIEFSLDNASFDDDFEGEMERVLETAKELVFDLVATDDEPADLHDSNGNTIGTVTVEDEGEEGEEGEGEDEE